MTIDEAIAREREMAEMHRNDIVPKEDYHNMPWIDKENELNMRSAEEHELIAEWLEELKDYRDKNKMVVRVDCENIDSIKDKIEELSKYAESQYNKAIDDFANALKENYDYLPQILSQEVFGGYIDEYAEQLKAGGKNGTVSEKYNGSWNPIEEKLPPDDSYILLSFSNFSIPIVGRYEEDEDGGGNFFAGDEDEPLISQDLFVNAWMPLPKCYEEE